MDVGERVCTRLEENQVENFSSELASVGTVVSMQQGNI